MRKIKFRAWDGNRIRTSFLIQNEHGAIYITKSIVDTELLPQNWELMQFTGLLDKSGKEIYEGDIIRQSRWIKEVEFENCSFGIKKEIEGQTAGMCFAPLYQFEGELEVIGNIWENPDLLKEAK